MWLHTSSMSNGRSGMRITSAPPAIPEYTASQPAWRPITSTMITRLCDSAVVCRRSIASVAIWTAVWKPNVKSVAARSLSIVFGTPTTPIPSSCEPSRDAERVLAADRDQRVEAAVRHRRAQQVDAAVDLVRVRARGPEDRPAAVQDPARAVDRQVDGLVLDEAGPAIAEAHELVAVAVDALADDGADDRVEAGAVAAPGEHADSHGPELSPGSARARRPVPSRARTWAASAAGRAGTSCARPAASWQRGGAPRARAWRRAGWPRPGRRPSA